MGRRENIPQDSVLRPYIVSRMVSSGFLQEPHGVTTQKTSFFIVTAVKTSNLTYIVSFCAETDQQ
jgi:hypothetical protein